jgi:nitroreductase
VCDHTKPDSSGCLRQAQPRLGPIFPRFIEKEVADDCLNHLVDVPSPAASEWNLQTWRWIVVRDAAARKYLEAATYIKAPLSSAPVILICLADTLAWKAAPQFVKKMIDERKISEQEGREALQRVRAYYSSSPEVTKRTVLAKAFVAVHQVLLGAAEGHLSAYCVTEFDEARIKNQFHIPDNFLVAALLPVGYSAQAPPPIVSRFPLGTFIYKEKFGETHQPNP